MRITAQDARTAFDKEQDRQNQSRLEYEQSRIRRKESNYNEGKIAGKNELQKIYDTIRSHTNCTCCVYNMYREDVECGDTFLCGAAEYLQSQLVGQDGFTLTFNIQECRHWVQYTHHQLHLEIKW